VSSVHCNITLKSVFTRHYTSIHRIFMGKNSIAQMALGRTPEEEYRDNLRHISKVSNMIEFA